MTAKAVLFYCLLAAAAVPYIGCGTKPKGKFTEEQMRQIPLVSNDNLPEASGGMVLGFQSETITTNEILDAVEPYLSKLDPPRFAEEAPSVVSKAVQRKVTNILLYQEARKKATDNIDEMLDKAVETEIARFVADYGNNYALAESKLKEMGMDWRSYRDFQKKRMMVQSHLSSTLKEEKRFSRRELADYYEQNKAKLFCKEGKVGFSIIEIWPALLSSEQLGADSPAEAAKRIGTELMAHLKEGAEFAELAKLYHGDVSAVGGKVTPIAIGDKSLKEPYRSLAERAIQMQPGQVDGPFALAGHLFILKLDSLEIGGCRPFEEVQNEVAQRLQFEYIRQQEQEIFRSVARKADIVQIERFAEFCAQAAYRRWGGNSPS
ncbi:MAG: peptidyl-prolyl cis-trans isomerase [Planctomycetales bacterium]|nr:peptidyl-prolyl cis-trans isomerase [Planctomycetales bacterium]